ncbi:helix-turn-helix domain-containing protein [Kitasatospora sp. NBC_00240]|uniref:helix-turn-helix domain-containing protein n=1 Tax=Kitasatospora sp. NBC_00240 TaxID=2903567 RepID=UPI00225350EA|nr:helix-turn-helix transcriptional regulator [Kitasatospora sp. NBC_00240]MCX5211480.1 helix-turn-helix domain-containing protein [Kitasatospora sp. NBC_00240]
MTEQPKGRRAIEIGATGMTVARNLSRLRKTRQLTTRQLSADLERQGRPIPASGITRMEKGERQVTVDDLLALAVALNVSPSALLLPLDDSPEHTVEIAGAGSVPADVAWDWADGKRPLRLPSGDTRTAVLEYALHSRPAGRREPQYLHHRGERSAQELAEARQRYEFLASIGGADLEGNRKRDPEAFEGD